MKRIRSDTPRSLAVVLSLVVAALLGAPAAAAPDELAVDRAIRTVLRPSVPLVKRLEAARTVLDGWTLADGEALLRAGTALLEDTPQVGGWLLLRGCETAWPDAEIRAELSADIDALLDRPAARPSRRAAWAAAASLLRHRPEAATDALLKDWPPSPFVRAVLERDLAPLPAPDAEASSSDVVARRFAASLPALRALDRAESEDTATMRGGMDDLLALGPDALPVLLAEAGRATEPLGEGWMPRAARALVALGLLGRREATPALVACLQSPDGWIQVAAATALGDLNDPAAAIALCRKLTYRGELLRPLDQWDYPGERETTVAREDWRSSEYFVVDGAAADALLRMGLPGAAEWLIRKHLDPGKANFRIRVLQDAVDSLRRAVPSAPVAAYDVDTGWNVRRTAFEGLLTWWREHAFDAALLPVRFDATDERYRRAARRLVERLRGRSVMELQIAQESAALLGRAFTPALIEVLQVTSSRVLRTEIARALGAVRDPEAIDPLLGLSNDRAAFLRAVAIESLGAYVGRDPRVVPALVDRLDDPEAAPRVAALSVLSRAAVSASLAAAVRAHTPEAFRTRFGTDDRDYRMAWTVAMLIQEGESHWPPVRDGLAHSERYVRRSWWDLLRRSIPLPNHTYDAVTDPAAPGWEAVDERRVLEALQDRRAR